MREFQLGPDLVDLAVGASCDRRRFKRVHGFESRWRNGDRSGTLQITLSNSRTGRHLDQLVIGLYEVDDFTKPTIVWEPGGRVHVQDIEGKGHRLSATLDIHQWERRE